MPSDLKESLYVKNLMELFINFRKTCPHGKNTETMFFRFVTTLEVVNWINGRNINDLIVNAKATENHSCCNLNSIQLFLLDNFMLSFATVFVAHTRFN